MGPTRFHFRLNFGHFGAPDALGSGYGVMLNQYDTPGGSSYDTSGSFNMEADAASSVSPMVSSSEGLTNAQKVAQADTNPVSYKGYERKGKQLPFLKDGANDADVESATGIKNLVTEVTTRMILLNPAMGSRSDIVGKLTDAAIKAFQSSAGLKADGIIGKNTYQKLSFGGPYPQSSGGGTTYNPSTDNQLAIGSSPFYKKKWFMYSAIGVVCIATIAVLAYPKE